MKSIREVTFAAIDFESAGTMPGFTDVPVQIGIARWSSKEQVYETWMSYLKTNRPISWTAEKIHGITKEDLKGAPDLLSLWGEVSEKLKGNVLVAHGFGTEKRYLRVFPEHGLGPWVDTLQLSKSVLPDLKSYTLSDICDYLNLTEKIRLIVPEKGWHDALFDAVGSACILEEIIKEYQLESESIEMLLS